MTDALPPTRFLRELHPDDVGFLRHLLTVSAQAPSAAWVPWQCGTRALGWLTPDMARMLVGALAQSTLCNGAVIWDAEAWSEPERSFALQEALGRLHGQGLITGWRDERFSFWSQDTETPDDQPPLFAVERAGFRPLGLLSHAVHINGFTPDGALWCGRRSLNKATDPGMLDNVTAGGLPAHESILECAVRELQEEAGLQLTSPGDLHSAGQIRVRRPDTLGWHDEMLHVFNLTLPVSTQPVNQDGEVSDFLRLAPHAVIDRLRAGEFTVDAGVSLAQGLNLNPL